MKFSNSSPNRNMDKPEPNKHEKGNQIKIGSRQSPIGNRTRLQAED